MPPHRSQTSRRGRGQFRKNNDSGGESVPPRVPNKVIYPKSANVNERNLRQKYKFVRNVTVSHSVVSLPNEQRVRTITKKFVKAYYEAFDQPGRPNLQPLYNSDAFFSFSATDPLPTIGRNLFQVLEPQQRLSMLIKGDTNISGALATYPPTEHVENCQTIDIPYYIANPMSIASIHAVVTGVFKDTSAQTDPLRSFTRVFVLKHVATDKPTGEPVYQIFNDIFMLQPPTKNQITKFHQDHQAMRRLLGGVNQPNSSSTTTANSLASDHQLSNHQEECLKSIMARTRMNRASARKLLEEQNWNEDVAMAVFKELYQRNILPPDLFE